MPRKILSFFKVQRLLKLEELEVGAFTDILSLEWAALSVCLYSRREYCNLSAHAITKFK